MVPYYDRLSPCRIQRNTGIYRGKNDRLLSQYTEAIYGLRFTPFFPVYDCIAPYTDTEIYDRNTGPCNTTKHDRIWSNTDCVRSFTSLYGFRNHRPGIIFFVSHVKKEILGKSRNDPVSTICLGAKQRTISKSIDR
jgi:hypothetical protein